MFAMVVLYNDGAGKMVVFFVEKGWDVGVTGV